MTSKYDCATAHAELAEEIEGKVIACKDEILEEVRAIRDDMERGLPRTKDGKPDFTGHATYHEGLMKAAEAQERFWNELRLDLAKKGAWALITVIVGLLLLGMATKFGISPPIK